MVFFVLLSTFSIFGYAAFQNITMTWVISNNPPTITLDDPSDGQVLNVNTTQFNWTSNDVDGDTLDHIWYADVTDTFVSPFLRVVDVNTDQNYTNTVAFDDGNWYWRVEVTDGDDINISETWNFTILTNVSNSFPYLSDWNLTPVIGDTDDTFVYLVNFTDPDNDTASFVNLTINGSYEYSMTEVDVGDTDTSDGKQYRYSTTLPAGSYNYTFTCSDGSAVNGTVVFDGPTVSLSGNVPPTQSDPVPVNGSSYLSLPLSGFNITVNDGNGDSMDVYVFTNHSGFFELVNSSIGVGNGTLGFTNTSWVSSYYTTYYWFVNVSDGTVWVNRSYYFMSDSLRIYDEYPSNGSYLQGLQPTVYFSLSNPSGYLMNYTIYVGNSSLNTSTVLGSGVNVSNGTYFYNNYYTASNYTSYWWRVYVNDSVHSLNESFVFTTTRSGGGMVNTGGSAFAVAAGGMMIGIIALVFVFSRRRSDKQKDNRGFY